MVDQAARTRADAIEAFAAVLRGLRDSVGNPSFREMSGRSRAISHTTLHEAAQGNRLPSWATTVEFVKACAADPGDYRERWERADRVIRSVSSPSLNPPGGEYASRPAAAIPAAGVTDRSDIDVDIDTTPADDDEALIVPERRNWRRLRFVLPAVAAVGVVAVVVVVMARRGTDSPAKKDGAGTSPTAQLSPADCPVHSANPPAARPAHTGDASAFIADITLPDCSHIRRGQTVTKVWRLKNVGTVPWTGYSLHRLDLPQQRNQCQTISDVPIDDTEPGQLVDVRTQITAPQAPGFCFVRFKTVDASGHVAFPGSRPVNFQVIVD